jgi:integrase
VRRLLKVPTTTRTEQRDRAAIAFLFLSGARDGALVSLPIQAVDLTTRTVQQDPRLGVKTKFGKSATTFLLDIPDLLAAVSDWDHLVRDTLPPDALWYATLATDGMNFTGKTQPGRGRASAVRNGLRKLSRCLEFPYMPPHSLRHGHAVYAIQRCRNIAQLKAVSQNLMHSSLRTTEQIYGGLPDDSVGAHIAALTSEQRSAPDAEFKRQAARLLQRILETPEMMDFLLQDTLHDFAQKQKGTS